MRPRLQPWLTAFILLSILCWVYWPTLLETAERWLHDPQYQHGFLVPLFSLFLLWRRRWMLNDGRLSQAEYDQALAKYEKALAKVKDEPAAVRQQAVRQQIVVPYEKLKKAWAANIPSWWGVAVLLAGVLCRAGGIHYFYGYFDAISLLFCLAGAALVIGGMTALRWSWSAILFLGFMVPLPFRLQMTLGGSLQDVATKMSTYLLQTCGVPAVSEGRIILINDIKIGVVEACSGLGMLVTFLAISTAIAILQDGWWRKAVVIVSAVPVAVLANVVRIAATGMLFAEGYGETADFVFHLGAGLLMMPLAVLFVFIELYFLDRIIVERAPKGPPVPVMFNSKRAVSSAP
jgi:exosortase